MFIAVGYLGMSSQLPFGHIDQPGAGVFPVIVGVILILASLTTMWEGWQMDKGEEVDLPTGTDRKRLLSLIGLMFGYFLTIPWLGQILSGTLFCIVMMRILSDISWPRIVMYSLVMSILVHGVFIFLLKVPMPRGILTF